MSEQSSAERSAMPNFDEQGVRKLRLPAPTPTIQQTGEPTEEGTVSAPNAVPDEIQGQASSDLEAASAGGATQNDPVSMERLSQFQKSSTVAPDASSFYLPLAHPERLHAFAKTAEALQAPRVNGDEDDDEDAEPQARTLRRASKRYGWLGGLDLSWENIRCMFEGQTTEPVGKRSKGHSTDGDPTSQDDPED